MVNEVENKASPLAIRIRGCKRNDPTKRSKFGNDGNFPRETAARLLNAEQRNYSIMILEKCVLLANRK